MPVIATHEVLNQAPPLIDYNSFEADLPLREAMTREGGGWGIAGAQEVGAMAGSAEAHHHARRAETNEPILHTHDARGHRIDAIELDPSWHWLLRKATEHQMATLPWRNAKPGAHVVRAALFMLWSQVSQGVMCPVTMTYGGIPALRAASAVAAEWEPRLLETDYQRSALCGMAMTEKQGGSDVRANTTVATPIGGDYYELTGHKWFCSYPPCDIFLTLAQSPGGLSCFLFEPGAGFEIQRLKDKLGRRSLPSAEVEFRGLAARLLGEEGRGVQTIIEMVNHTRLDCVLSTVAGMRLAVAEAVNHTRHRSAFGEFLAAQPAMANVLADLALESEAATAAGMRLARAYDEDDTPFRRLATAVLKYWICKRGAGVAIEALECLGGNGYVEESPMPQIYRDIELNSIWEGSGNVVALDVLRALTKVPDALPAYLAECRLGSGADRRLDAHLSRLEDEVTRLSAENAQWQARRLAEDLGLALQASLLIRHAPNAVADAFCASRLEDRHGNAYGTLPVGHDAGAIIARALAL